MLFQKFKIQQNILFTLLLLSDNTAGIQPRFHLHFNSSTYSQAISFHFIAMINQLIQYVDIVVIILSMFFGAHCT